MRNPERRIALLDAAVEVLAADGARGLTFRRIDAGAGVPLGTTSNYFASRDELLDRVARHILDRLAPDPAEVEHAMSAPPTRALDTVLMHELTARIGADRAAYLALWELRLEATRRPELAGLLTATLRDELERNIAFHLDAGLPGDRTTVVVLYLAMTGLLVEHLTLPEMFGDDLDGIVADVVAAIVPP